MSAGMPEKKALKAASPPGGSADAYNGKGSGASSDCAIAAFSCGVSVEAVGCFFLCERGLAIFSDFCICIIFSVIFVPRS
jgi:hypothetical protein